VSCYAAAEAAGQGARLPGERRSGDPAVGLSRFFQYVAVADLSSRLQEDLRDVVESGGVEAFLIPEATLSNTAVPLAGERCAFFRNLSAGVRLNAARAALGVPTLERLCINGVLAIEYQGEMLTGAAAALCIGRGEEQGLYERLETDDLSLRCLRHGARFPVTAANDLAQRLYGYNNYGLLGCDDAVDLVARTNEIISVGVPAFFDEMPASPLNPGWRYFVPRNAPSRTTRTEANFKLYVSPQPSDLLRCLVTLTEELPRLPLHTWKIGRNGYGLTRADKICLYFDDQVSAESAARILTGTLTGVTAQAVPFTRRYDEAGLVSGGMDPPRSSFGARARYGVSWREWVSRRAAVGMFIAQTTPQYPLEPVQAALVSLYMSGINPGSWECTERDFWRV